MKRISDLAIEVGMDSNVLLQELRRIGIDVSTHLAYLDEYVVEILLLNLERSADEKSKSWKSQKRCPICDTEYNNQLPPACEKCGWVFIHDKNLQNDSGKLLVATKRIWNDYLNALKRINELEEELQEIKTSKSSLEKSCAETSRESTPHAIQDNPDKTSISHNGYLRSMRVVELARELGISSRHLIEEIRKKGIEVSSHMSILDGKTSYLIRSMYGKKEGDAHKINNSFIEFKSMPKTILIKKKPQETNATVRAECMHKIATILSSVVEKKNERYGDKQDNKSC